MEDMERRALLGVAGVAGIGALAAMAKAGPLTPPGGAVAPTGKTLQEVYDKIPGVNGTGDGRIPLPGGVSSVSITQPGSYVLTGNITTGTIVVVISSSNVTLDLNGYALTSTGTASGATPIRLNSTASNITVRNGYLIGGYPSVSLSAGVTSLSDVLLEKLVISRNRGLGINLNIATARNCIIRDCDLLDTGGGTVATDNLTLFYAINLAGTGHVVENCRFLRFINNGTGAPLFRGVNSPGGVTHVRGCTFHSETAITGTAVQTLGVYRDNTVFNFSTKYGAGGVDGGGNV